MKSTNRINSTTFNRPLVAPVAATLVLALATVTSFAQNARVLPLNSSPYGKSYGQWAVAWWQWGLGVPVTNNPVLDTTGEFAGIGQSRPVWFLGGSFGGLSRAYADHSRRERYFHSGV